MGGRVTGFVAMRWFVLLAMLVLAQLPESPAGAAPSCAREDFALAVDRAGAALRQLNADNAPRLRAKMRELKEARGWPDAGFEEKAYEILQDERMAALDMQANDLLAKLDALGTVDPSAEPDCAKLQELTATSLELQATMKAKAAYTLVQARSDARAGPRSRPEPKSKAPTCRNPHRCCPRPKPLRDRLMAAAGRRRRGRHTRWRSPRCRHRRQPPSRRRRPRRRLRRRRDLWRWPRTRAATASTRSWPRAPASSARSRPTSVPSSSSSSRRAGVPPDTSWEPRAAARSSPACATARAPSMCAPAARRRSTGTGPRSAPTWAPTAPRRCS